MEKDGNNEFKIGEKYVMQSAFQVGLLEKDIENLIADQPQVLFPNEEILVIAQSISFKNMADVLALDATGNLIIIEIKRDSSDRATVGQLLEYAAKKMNVTYDELNDTSRKYGQLKNDDLFKSFKEFYDLENFDIEDIGKNQRIVIVAPQSDEGLQQIVKWLRTYGVPIEFVPFNLFADNNGQPKLFSMAGVEDTPESVVPNSTWRRHWIFNTNETHSALAYKQMFEKGVAAIYGYANGSKNLQGSSAGDTILAYVNRKGILAIGTIIDGQVEAGTGVFLNKDKSQLPDEYHLKVEWKTIANYNNGVTASQAAQMGYNLPVRTVFGKLHKGALAEKIAEELRKRLK